MALFLLFHKSEHYSFSWSSFKWQQFHLNKKCGKWNKQYKFTNKFKLFLHNETLLVLDFTISSEQITCVVCVCGSVLVKAVVCVNMSEFFQRYASIWSHVQQVILPVLSNIMTLSGSYPARLRNNKTHYDCSILFISHCNYNITHLGPCNISPTHTYEWSQKLSVTFESQLWK